MTPAIKALKRAKVSHQVLDYPHDPRAPAYGLEAVEALGLAPQSVFKTLLAQLDDGRLVVAMVPVDAQLDLKALARTAGARKAAMAEPSDAERATGYVLGGISPLGQKKRLATFIDASIEGRDPVHVSGGRRGLEIALASADLIALTDAKLAPLAR
ncbi:Cys-tRNA(Pro) deacylase [Halomonas salipaludis]|uniref:Cys-tRNA(Pro)/Cys-tRNA(Cys) deacylase n=1 Tax=Halomonas salipaludis TaxID=2032625 RepID=A0A2A2ETS4_9GAMM|nr:Cys-tRNA(Pro) deacylase [Halomonas salipaludis]PAU75874.1 Cys-tRNA(Pro) deacylase [Halomonas salipaludis]